MFCGVRVLVWNGLGISNGSVGRYMGCGGNETFASSLSFGYGRTSSFFIAAQSIPLGVCEFHETNIYTHICIHTGSHEDA